MNAFHVLGVVLAIWAVVLTALGLTRPEFPRSRVGMTGVITISVLLVALVIGSAIFTSAVEDAEHQEETLEHAEEAGG